MGLLLGRDQPLGKADPQDTGVVLVQVQGRDIMPPVSPGDLVLDVEQAGATVQDLFVIPQPLGQVLADIINFVGEQRLGSGMETPVKQSPEDQGHEQRQDQHQIRQHSDQPGGRRRCHAR